MIERIDGAPAGVLAFKAVGEVTLDDYTQVLKPALDTALSGGRKLRAVFMIGPEFTGYESGVKREDLGLGLGFLRKWERCCHRDRRAVDPRPDAPLRLADGPAPPPVPTWPSCRRR